MAKVFIVDDEISIRRTLREILEFEQYEVAEAADGVEALAGLKKHKPDVILLDIKMPKMDGLEALERMQELAADVPVIMISGHATIDTAVEAVKRGAFDFISKPLDLNRLLITLRNALDKSSLVTETKVLRRRVVKAGLQEMIGESALMRQIQETIDRVAPTEARVLVTGPNGTGKEMVARWIHEKSQRQDGPLVEVNCAAIPGELIESELFGHEKGAFTSAHKQRIGKFEQANGGTLFLDEIGDMSLAAQAKVLRALQEQRISRVGGDKEIKVDVRVVAATNKDLLQEIAAGRFREDLYHRLAVIIIAMPSLADRNEDIPLLVTHFLDQVCQEYGTKPKTITAAALSALQQLDWTGNIRELRNVIERLIILSDGNSIELDAVERYVIPVAGNSTRDLRSWLSRFDSAEAAHRFVDDVFTSQSVTGK
ncbi:MAG: sigma-54-dependent Fis family transcriptional regulator [Lewinellaceae bacterium]|nr:sigma-54-dependent Fis family transcriptional regulator [Lewinellaceae bacterium]